MLLDADILIDLIRQHPAATAWLASLPRMPLAAGFAALELAYGAQSLRELRAVWAFLRAFQLAWPTDADLDRALFSYAPLRLSGGLGMMDAVIAATAVGLGVPLGTFNVRHFRTVPGLKTEQPYNR